MDVIDVDNMIAVQKKSIIFELFPTWLLKFLRQNYFCINTYTLQRDLQLLINIQSKPCLQQIPLKSLQR